MDAKDEVKQRLSVEDVVGDYLELKRAGRNFKAISPFSSERTPSFMVSPEKQIWHDFSSNKGGDIFSFIMEVEGVDFREALEILARKANVDLSEFQKGDGSAAKLKKRLLAAHVQAVQFYHLCLSRKPEALHYIKDVRRFTPDTIRTWQLGYSPDDGKSLYAFLKKRGFSEAELSKAGLITKRRDGWGDMFRGRIMIPLSDGQGNVVGFTARLLKDDKNAPKYFNTPQTPIYDKGRQVFGLHLAKDAIRRADQAVLVEGNLDVIASHQVEVQNVVACAGTAMTADHLRSLSRLTSNIRLAFDADKAGINATERAIPIAQSVGVDLKVITMPEGIKDPDELIQKDPNAWRDAAQNALDIVAWTLNKYSLQYDKKTAEGKRQLSTKALAVIRNLQDPVEREHHLKELAKSLDTSVDALLKKLVQQKPTSTIKKPTKAVPAEPDELAYQDDFLALNGYFPDVRDSLQLIEAGALVGEQRQAVFSALGQLPPHQQLEAEAENLHLNPDYVKILTLTVEEKYASFSPADIMAETMALARRIKQKIETKKRSALTEEIREAEARGDHSAVAQLLEKYQTDLKRK
ncbi:MAG: primase [Patescibacteria group bacterium]|nr:primase [Patescibacteria group bacterium]